MMKTATKRRTIPQRVDEGDWLYRLLADIHMELARQPSPRAVDRIRARLLSQLETPTKAAA